VSPMYQGFFWAARVRKRPRPGAIARPEVGRATEPPSGVSAHSGHAPCRRTTIPATIRATEANGCPGVGAKSVRSTAVIMTSAPDRSKPAAVLGAVKAEPCGWPPRRPASTAPARGCLGTTAGRGGETGFRSNRETVTGQGRRGIHAIARRNRRFTLFVLDSTASESSRRVVKCLEIVFDLIPGISENDAFTIRWKERTMNQN